ncbi:MFS transporter [Actinoplanes sp. L3-i22]|uniref:MFS transporter n=1 Tax=Actinoplanes sp. L3-i22 TaxID=2836373 RepID=UPI001C748D29|nr:MFS transporter [Actinoplanes sp. L3-i22]BCY10598.1 MFS transporter [Actinoplanes sp. L3-i22]
MVTTEQTTVERLGPTLVMACVAVFVAYLPVTTVAVSLPAIQAALGASTADLSWVSDAFVLPMAALILTAGVFGDVHGRRKVFLAGLLCCAAGSAVALSASSIGVVWLGQALAGIGAAALLPTTLALISHAVPDPRRRGGCIALWATALMLALAVGPLLAGVVLEHAGWRWIYLPSIPLALLTAALAIPLVTDSRAPGKRHLDGPGQVTVAVAIVALVFAVIEGGAGSFTEPAVLGAFAVAALALAAFVGVERRSDSPMLSPALFASRGFTGTAVIAMVSFLGVIGSVFVLSLYFGLVQQLSTMEAALRLLVSTAVPVVAGPLVGRLMHRVPTRWLLSGGLVVSSGALFWLGTVDAGTSFVAISGPLALFGLGLGFVLTPMTATAVGSVPFPLAGMAAAGNNAFRQVGGALGPAVLGALLTSRAAATLPAHLTEAGVGDADRRAAEAAMADSGFQAVASIDYGDRTGAVPAALGRAFLDGFHLALTVSAALMLLAAVIAVVLLKQPKA